MMEASLPARPLIGLLLRLVYQHYAQHIEAALREAGFGDIRPAHANVFPFVPPEGITVSALADLARVESRRWPRPSSSSSAWATSSAVRTRATGARGWCSSPSAASRSGRSPTRPPRSSRSSGRELTSHEELETLRASLLRLLTELRASP